MFIFHLSGREAFFDGLLTRDQTLISNNVDQSLHRRTISFNNEAKNGEAFFQIILDEQELVKFQIVFYLRLCRVEYK